MSNIADWITNFYIFHDALSSAVSVSIENIADFDLTSPLSGEFLYFDGEHWINGNITPYNLSELSDMDIASVVSGEFLMYNGINWENVSKAPDHISSDGLTPKFATLVFGTSDPPAANTVPDGTLFIKYTEPV
jgi:hypothetical protein